MNAPATAPLTVAGVSAARIAALAQAETERFVEANPKSRTLAEKARAHFPGGVPMHWMLDWPTPYPLFASHAEGARLVTADGHTLIDFCLGDTGSMFGHSPPPVAHALQRQAARGLTAMLPTEDALAAGERLSELFGLPLWQVAMTASDANRYALRVARAVTGRQRIAVFDGCYHGTVDETMVRLDASGRARARPGLLGQTFEPTDFAIALPFNDVDALRRALRSRAIACVIAEPVMTNSAMVLPDPGFHDTLRQLCDETGTLLLIDETHTISSGYGGYTKTHGLKPDLFVCGKAIAGGFPCAVWGMTRDVAQRLDAVRAPASEGHSGMGTTLSANPMALAALAAHLTQVMTRENYRVMERGAARLIEGLKRVIAARGLPWHAVRVGARVEFILAPAPLRNGREAAAAHHGELEGLIALGLLNRGVLIAPFHAMMLVSPATSDGATDRLVDAFDEVTGLLAG
jgi:glutamate-1-semialdehyde 2,1-aminomutase